MEPGLYANNFETLFERGLSLLTTSTSDTSMAKAYAVLDLAAGFCSVPVYDLTKQVYGCEIAGVSAFVAWGLNTLPVHVVRHVEYERIARHLSFDAFICTMQGSAIDLLTSMDPKCVSNIDDAQTYLTMACVMSSSGNSFASASLEWLLAEDCSRIPRNKRQCSYEYCEAIKTRERDRAILLGTYLDHVTAENFALKRAQSACIIGRALSHGTEFIPKDPVEAEHYYLKALELEPGNPIANNNLGMMYAQGESGVKVSIPRAIHHLESAVNAGDVSVAPRNLATILCSPKARHYRDTAGAIDLLATQAMRGSEEGRKRAVRTLQTLARSPRFKLFLLVNPEKKGVLRRLLDDDEQSSSPRKERLLF